MNTEPTTTQDSSEADEALGAALGSAIDARVTAAVEPPPVSLIAERAQAQARARTVQRTVVGIAASITLLAGGLVAYDAFGNDTESPTVATDPTVPPDSTVPATETPTTVASDEVPPIDEPVASTLRWTESDPVTFGSDLIDFYEAETVGDGRVIARTWSNTGSQLIISEDGTNWTQVAVPEGVSPDFIDISGDRWLLAGQDTTLFDSLGRAFYSDNQGANWTELALEGTPGDQSSITLAMASGQNMVIVFKIPPDRTERNQQIMALIEASGLAPDGAQIESWSLQANTVSFWTADSPDPQHFEISDEEQDALYESVGDERIRVYSSNGGAATPTAEYVSWHTTGHSNAESFYIAITTPDDELLLSSRDGHTWTETSIDNRASFATGLLTTTRTDEWFVGGYVDEIRVESLDQLGDPESTTATMTGVSHLISLDVGPAGMVAAAFPANSDPVLRETVIGWSTDGTNWEWLTPFEAFGVDYDDASVRFAVGNDFVLAQVMGFARIADTETLEAQPPRWFKATVK